MEAIKIKRINKEESNENLNHAQAYLVIELEPKPSEEWNQAFDQNAVNVKQKQYESAICNAETISVKYPKTKNRDEVLKQVEALVNETNQEQNDFNSWIDQNNVRLAGK